MPPLNTHRPHIVVPKSEALNEISAALEQYPHKNKQEKK